MPVPLRPKPQAPYKVTDATPGEGQKFPLVQSNGEAETNGYKLGLKPPLHVEIFFDARDRSYWYRINGRFISLGKSELTMFMKNLGLKEKIYFDGQREMDWPIFQAINQRIVDYAGPLAGHRTGIITDGSGRKYLVTDEAKGVFGDNKQMSLDESGEPEFFMAFIRELLPEGQWEFLCHWLAVALRSMAARDFTPGQVCVFAGEGGCGKSLVQCIITEILGGRQGNPFAYMIGDTNFNRDFCGAEHWQIEDPRGSKAMQERIDFGARLKEGTVNKSYKIHQKNKDAIDLPLFRRITISINMELEYLSVLPPMDPSIADKISLYLCTKVSKALEQFREMDGPEKGRISRARIEAAYMAEIPRIRLWLLKNFKARTIPEALRDDRFVIKAWHQLELLHALQSISHEVRLLELIDILYFAADEQETVHTAVDKKSGEVQKDLMDKDSFEAGKILRYPGACGSHLGKLARSHPERVSKRIVNGASIWTINPPAKQETK